MDILAQNAQKENILFFRRMIPMNILIINAGSSSLKYQLMDPDTGVVSAKGLCERIGIDGRLNHTKAGCDKVVKEIPAVHNYRS